MTVTCRWTPGCHWSLQRDHEADARNALYAHLARTHGHDVHAEKERTETTTAQQDSAGQTRYDGGTTKTAPAGNRGLTTQTVEGS